MLGGNIGSKKSTMKCLSPITITNRSKLLVPSVGERLKYEVRCGKCANCQTTAQKEWYFRAMQEFHSTVQNNGFVLMDCLTYSDEFVPRLSRFYPDLPKDLDFMCFDYYDLRFFLMRLRDYLRRRGYEVKDKLRYFAATEYGTSENHTHRPHIHILFYSTVDGLDNFTLSKAISENWHYGRTDGLPYKSESYVNNYTIFDGLVSSQRVCKYVSKYVMKDSVFQVEIDKRVNALLYHYYETKFKYYRLSNTYVFTVDYEYRPPVECTSWKTFESFLKSSTAKKLKTNLLRYLNQFHRQSCGFGAQYLQYIDKEEVINSNLVSMQDSKQVVFRLGLPLYYRRKLFYHLVEVNGMKSWQLNYDDDAKRYKLKRDADKLQMLKDEIHLYNYQTRNHLDIDSLSDYVLNKRWRDTHQMFVENDLTIFDKLNYPDLIYSYSTRSDYSRFHGAFVTDKYLGVPQTSYINAERKLDISVMSFFDYIKMYSFENQQFENDLEDMRKWSIPLNASIQANYNNRQELNQVYKQIRKRV